MILVAGDSFVHTGFIQWFPDPYITKAYSGAGNEYIAHQVIETVHTQPIDYVLVLFTGITRIDFSVDPVMKPVIDQGYEYQDTVGNQHWIFSGGLIGSWTTGPGIADKALTESFKMQYKGDLKYFTDRTAYYILTVYNTLKALNIPFDMGFIYNPLNPSANDEHSLGQMDTDSRLFQALPWDEFIPTYPYDWCKERNLLSKDDFHPTDEGLKLWLDSLTLNGKAAS